jgi:hypothetical protein
MLLFLLGGIFGAMVGFMIAAVICLTRKDD